MADITELAIRKRMNPWTNVEGKVSNFETPKATETRKTRFANMERSSTPLYDLQVDVHTLQRPALDKTSNSRFPAPLPLARIWERIRR